MKTYKKLLIGKLYEFEWIGEKIKGVYIREDVLSDNTEVFILKSKNINGSFTTYPIRKTQKLKLIIN